MPPQAVSPAERVPPAPPEPLGTDSPQALWQALLQRFSDRPAVVAWLRFLQLVRIEGETGVLVPRAGHREVLPLATPQRLDAISQELSALRGGRVRLVVRDMAGESGPAGDDDPASGAPTSGAEADAAHRRGQLDRRQAMQLPLVRMAMQAFPDAILTEAREEQAEEAKGAASGGKAADDTPGDTEGDGYPEMDEDA